jgi:serine/threonine protein phosphatase PrpC
MDSYEETHKMIVANNYYHDSSLSGTTLTTIFITDENLLFTANVGDTLAMLFQIEKDPFDDDIDHTLLTMEHEPLH